MNKLLLLLYVVYVNSFYMNVMPNKIFNKIITSLKTKNKLQNMIKFSSINNPMSNLTKKGIDNYLSSTKYNIFYNNFDHYVASEMKSLNASQKLFNVIINVRNTTNKKHYIDNNNNVELIFKLVNEKKK